MAYERVLLKTIKFDLQVAHPYSFLLNFVKRIRGEFIMYLIRLLTYHPKLLSSVQLPNLPSFGSLSVLRGAT